MSALKNGVLLRNRKAENRPLMKVICSLLLLAPCLSALMISCCKYFLINVKLMVLSVFYFMTIFISIHSKENGHTHLKLSVYKGYRDFLFS